jgi:zinc transporter
MMAESANALGAATPDSDPAIAGLIPGIVWAFRLHSDGSAEPLSIDKPIEFTHDGRLWLHFNLADARAR